MARSLAPRERPGCCPPYPRNRIRQAVLQEWNGLGILSNTELTNRAHAERWHAPAENALQSSWGGSLRLSKETAETPWDNKRHNRNLSSTQHRRVLYLGCQKQTASSFHTDFRELVSRGLTADR